MSKNKLQQAIELYGEIVHNSTELISRTISGELFHHLSKEQLDLLYILYLKGPTSPGDLAYVQGVHKSAISNRINKLLKKGLVYWIKSPNEVDKRFKLIALTQEGNDLERRINRTVVKLLEELLEDISDSKVDVFLEIMSLVKQKINKRLS